MNKHRGFTIVELLIVIVVIGILAAIVIVAFNGVQNRANDTAIQSDLNSFAKRMELFKVDSPVGMYPITNADLETVGAKFTVSAYKIPSSNNLLFCRGAGTTTAAWALVAMGKSNKAWVVTHQNSAREYTGAGITSTNTLDSQTLICPSALGSLGQQNANPWGYSGSGWATWTGQ